MNNDKDFANDPIFKDLRKFAQKQTGPETMPAELFEAFRNANSTKVRSKWIGRSVIGLLFIGVALPSLAAAHVLPAPVSNVVNRVVHVVAAPIRVVASVVSSNPAPTNNVTTTPSPTTSESLSPTQTLAPVPTQSMGPAPKVGSNEDDGEEGSKPVSKPTTKPLVSPTKKAEIESESDDEGGVAPKLPIGGSASAPAVGGSTSEKSEVKTESKSSEKADD